MEEGMATHSTILAWRSPKTEEPGRLQPEPGDRGVANSRTQLSDFHFTVVTNVILHFLGISVMECIAAFGVI